MERVGVKEEEEEKNNIVKVESVVLCKSYMTRSNAGVSQEEEEGGGEEEEEGRSGPLRGKILEEKWKRSKKNAISCNATKINIIQDSEDKNMFARRGNTSITHNGMINNAESKQVK